MGPCAPQTLEGSCLSLVHLEAQEEGHGCRGQGLGHQSRGGDREINAEGEEVSPGWEGRGTVAAPGGVTACPRQGPDLYTLAPPHPTERISLSFTGKKWRRGSEDTSPGCTARKG